MMLGEQSVVSRDWQEAGRQAELAGVKGIVLMVCGRGRGSIPTPSTFFLMRRANQ